MHIGRRAQLNGSVAWVELGSDEVDAVLEEAAQYNQSVWSLCARMAAQVLKIRDENRRATLTDPLLRRDANDLAAVFFERLGVSSFTLLKNALEEKIDRLKTGAIAHG